jgi:hypothetical protein
MAELLNRGTLQQVFDLNQDLLSPGEVNYPLHDNFPPPSEGTY